MFGLWDTFQATLCPQASVLSPWRAFQSLPFAVLQSLPRLVHQADIAINQDDNKFLQFFRSLIISRIFSQFTTNIGIVVASNPS